MKASELKKYSDVKKLSKKELIKLFNGLYDMIETACCYGTKDLIMYDHVQAEMDNRGIEVKTKIEVVG